MADQITISKTLSIRDCGYDENWPEAQKLLDTAGLSCNCKQGTGLILGNTELVKTHFELFKKIGELVKQAYQRS
jgi:hypothetical protein